LLPLWRQGAPGAVAWAARKPAVHHQIRCRENDHGLPRASYHTAIAPGSAPAIGPARSGAHGENLAASWPATLAVGCHRWEPSSNDDEPHNDQPKRRVLASPGAQGHPLLEDLVAWLYGDDERLENMASCGSSRRRPPLLAAVTARCQALHRDRRAPNLRFLNLRA